MPCHNCTCQKCTRQLYEVTTCPYCPETTDECNCCCCESEYEDPCSYGNETCNHGSGNIHCCCTCECTGHYNQCKNTCDNRTRLQFLTTNNSYRGELYQMAMETLFKKYGIPTCPDYSTNCKERVNKIMEIIRNTPDKNEQKKKIEELDQSMKID